jgi:CRP/FNR family transcriptional regulator, nitrogen oxide reductase regulator
MQPLDSKVGRLHRALAILPGFRGLPAADRERVATLAILQQVERGEEIWHAGDLADSLTILVTGRVKVVRHEDAGDVILEIFTAGETVGAIAVYGGFPYPASAVALEPATLLRLPRRDWFDLLERDPRIARSVILELTRLTTALTRKLSTMHGTRVRPRIARFFLTLAERMGTETPEGTVIDLPLSRQEIAECVGTTIESAIRVMSRWNQDGVIVTERTRFVIPSLERLAAAAEAPRDGDA